MKKNLAKDTIIAITDSNIVSHDGAQEIKLVTHLGYSLDSIDNDGKLFSSHHYESVNGSTLDKSFEDVLLDKSRNKEPEYYDYYVENFLTDITMNFSTASTIVNDKSSLKSNINDLIKEIKETTSKGASVNFDNLKTKFTVNGVDFTFKELSDASRVFSNAKSILKNPGSTLDYRDYAEMGLVKSKVSSYVQKNLNKEQGDLLKSSMSTKIANVIKGQNEALYNLQGIKIYVNSNNKYYKFQNVAVATNVDYANKIMDVFANIDTNDQNALKSACNQYKSIMTPVYTEYGIYNTANNSALTEILNDDKDTLMNMADENFKIRTLSISEVRAYIKSRENIIDTIR